MNGQNNQGEEEEYEEEEIEVYEEVEVDEDAEVSDAVSPQKVPPNKVTNQKEDKPKLTEDSNNNPINSNIPKENEDSLNINKNIEENRNIINDNQNKDMIPASNNDNINTNVTDNRFLEEKIKFNENDLEGNLNNNNIREENFNSNTNINTNNQINNNFNTNENLYQSNFNPNINDNIYQSNNYNFNSNANNNNYQSNNFNDNNINNNMYQSNNYNPDDINNNIYQSNNYNENNYQSNNLNGNDSINQSNNFNFNPIVNDSNRISNLNTMNINNDYNFDLSNNFNFDNRNTENKYLNLDYKIIPGRESIDFQPEMKFPFSLEKKESNSIQNSLLKESVNNMNNIPEIEKENNLNEQNNNNISRQPQGHRSKIKRNNKKPLNLNFNNNYNNNQDFQNTSKNMNLNNDSYFKDTENSTNLNIINKNSILSNTNYDELPFDERPINPKNNTNYEDISSFDDRPIKPKTNLNYEDISSFDDRPIKPKTNLNYEELPFDERPIKSSLNNIITSQNEAQSNNINQDELNANKDIIQDKNENDKIQLNDKIRYNDPSNYYTFKRDDNNMNNPATNTDINQSIEINNNFINGENNNIEGVNMNEKDTNIVKDNIELNNGELNADNGNKMNENNNNNNEGRKNQNIKKSKEDEDYSNIIVQLSGNNEIIDLLDSKKWEEKKQGFIKLNEFLTENMKSDSPIENNFDTLFNYILLKLNNFRETNFNLMKEGISCLNTLFSYFKENNKSLDKKYLETIIYMSNEKLADSKIKQVYTQLLNLLIDIYSYKTVYDLLFDILLFKTNKLTVLKEYSIFIRDNIKKENSINDLDLKKIIEFSVKIANHTNPQIRSISIEIICLLYRFIGPDLKQLITGIKESTFKLIEKELDKIVFDDKDKNNSTNKNNKIKDLLNINSKKGSVNKNVSASAAISPSNSNSNLINNKRVDISKDITPKLLKEINRGKWVEKKEGIEYINSLIDKANNKISKNGLQELFDLIKEKLNDGNINLVKMTLQLLSRLILALEGQIKFYSKNLIYPLLLKLQDKNKQIRDETLTCIENWIKMQNFDIFAVHIPQFLSSSENFEIRNEMLNLLNKKKDLIRPDYPKQFFSDLTKAFLACLQDKNSNIRSLTEELIKSFSNFIPREKYILELKDIKRSISDSLYSVLDRLLPPLDQGNPEIIEQNGGNKIENKDKSKEAESSNFDTLLHHQQLVVPKKNVNRKAKKNNKIEGAHSVDKNNFKTNKKDTSFIAEIKNKNLLNASNINSTILNDKKDGKDKNRFGLKKINKKGKNKMLSCDRVPTTASNKMDKTIKFGMSNLNTENNNSRILNKKLANISSQDIKEIKKPKKKARNRSTINDKNNNKNQSQIITNNYYTKKDVKSLTAEKTTRTRKKITAGAVRRNLKNINAIKETPIKKVNPKKFINSKNKNEIFLASYKIKKGIKEKRYEKDKKNNFYFEVQNFDYLPKITELLKTIFAPEFVSKLLSNDLKNINIALTQLKILIDESINNDNDENFNKLMDNLDLLLKVIAIRVSNNQTASLIKSFFIFADTLINSYKLKNYAFNDTEINILLNVFADKLINNNLILKETACNLIWFLNDQIDNSKTFIMLIHLLGYKNAKLKSEIIDIVMSLYENSKFDNSTIYKVLKNLIRAYFDADFTSKKKVLSLLQDIYGTIGNEFWKYTKFMSSKDKDELHKLLVPENDNNSSREYDMNDLNSSNFEDDDSENNEIINSNKTANKKNILKLNDYDSENNNNKPELKRSITDNSKNGKKEDGENANNNNYNTNANIFNNNNKADDNKNSDNKCITEKELKEALDMLINPEEDLVEAIINIHYMTYRNYLQNKKIINLNADNIINCFIEVINKLFLNKPLRIKIIKYIILVLCKLCDIKEFIINISFNVQKDLINLILTHLLYENLNTLGDNDEGMVIWKSLNSIIAHIIEYCEVTKNISIIIEIEQKYRKQKPKLAEYSARCLVIITQNINKNYKNIDLKIIFNNIYSILGDFLEENNDLQLKEKTDQTIFITLRNLINELVKVKMEKILDDYNNWVKENNISDEKYILNWINESITKIKIKNNKEDEDSKKEDNLITNEETNENDGNGQVIMVNKRKSLDEIKKKWKELQENDNNNK